MSFFLNPNAVGSNTTFLTVMLMGLVLLGKCRSHSVDVPFKARLNFGYFNHLILIMFFLTITIVSLKLIAFQFNFDFQSIYARRLLTRDDAWNGYLICMGRSLLTVLGVYLACIQRKPFYGIFVVIFSAAIFSYDGTKTALIIPLFLVFICMIFYRTNSLFWPAFFIYGLIMLSVVEFYFMDTTYLSQYFTRRIMAIPGCLNTLYWDFFSENPKVFMTDSFGQLFWPRVYDISAPYLIGTKYLNDPTANANTGIWMGAYAHFGILGVAVISAIGGFLLGLIDNLSKVNHFMLGTLMCAWSEQMFHTSILTGGIFYIFVFMFIVRCSNILRSEVHRF
jgi:hypothetical protein